MVLLEWQDNVSDKIAIVPFHYEDLLSRLQLNLNYK